MSFRFLKTHQHSKGEQNFQRLQASPALGDYGRLLENIGGRTEKAHTALLTSLQELQAKQDQKAIQALGKGLGELQKAQFEGQGAAVSRQLKNMHSVVQAAIEGRTRGMLEMRDAIEHNDKGQFKSGYRRYKQGIARDQDAIALWQADYCAASTESYPSWSATVPTDSEPVAVRYCATRAEPSRVR